MTGIKWSRFWSKVAIGDGCWEWTAGRNSDGYGKFQVGCRQCTTAQRIAYELWYGVKPGKLCVLHHCDNPPCVRPSHLWLGTHQENTDDMVAKGRNRTKLKENQVKEIRERYKNGETHAALAAEFGVTRSNVTMIANQKRWRHV